MADKIVRTVGKNHALLKRIEAKMAANEAVDHPAHYGGDTTYEVIKVLEAWNILDFCLGNTIKYVARAGKKSANQIEDLKKARWYLDRRIRQLEGVE